jgi:hypothetical protein
LFSFVPFLFLCSSFYLLSSIWKVMVWSE